MANPWFRMYSEFSTDPKVQSMPEAMQRRLIMVFCLRCCNALATLHDDELICALRISDEELQETKALFIKKGFIDNDWNVINWDKRQYISDKSTERSRRHRAKKKESNGNETDMQQECNVAETVPDTDTDTDTEKNINPNGLIVVSNTDNQKPSRPDKPDCPHQKIIDLYHEVLPMCPQIRDWTPARATQLRARWNEVPERQNLDYWKRFFEYILTCDFLVGKAGTKPFFADLEWMTKSANFTKIREGKYENREVA